MGWRVPGWSGGAGGRGRSETRLYQAFGMRLFVELIFHGFHGDRISILSTFRLRRIFWIRPRHTLHALQQMQHLF